MKLKEQLLAVKRAAASFETADKARITLNLVRLGTPYDLAFFESLSDARWLSVLTAEGFYDNLPKPIKRADDTLAYPRLLALSPLPKLAKENPKQVFNVLRSLSLPDNKAVGDQIMKAVAAIDDLSLAVGLTPLVRSIAENTDRSTNIWLEDILAKWATGEAPDACFEVLRAVIPATTLRSLEKSRELNFVELDQNVIASLAAKRPTAVSALLFESLREWAKAKRKRQDELQSTESKSKFECDLPLTYWLRDFRFTQRGDRECEGVIARRLHSIGMQIFAADDRDAYLSFDSMLRSDPWHLFRRLRWQLYSEFPGKTLFQARRDTLDQIPNFGLKAEALGNEFLSMLEVHAKTNGHSFLNENEVQQIVESVSAVPPADDGTDANGIYHKAHQFKALHPLQSLLFGEASVYFSTLDTEESRAIAFRNRGYTSYSGPVRSKAPNEAERMDIMSKAELWDFLNNWTETQETGWSDSGWVRVDSNALASKFCEYVEHSPGQFDPADAWWNNISRAEILSKLIDRAIEHINAISETTSEPSQHDWQTWFGIAQRIVELPTQDPPTESDRGADSQFSSWNWANITVVKFLQSTLKLGLNVPTEFRQFTGRLLKQLFERRDPLLDRGEAFWRGEWLTTAINSVKGTSVEVLLEYALKQRAIPGETDDWIYDSIVTTLRGSQQSPAVYAVLGYRSALFLHLYGESIAKEPALLLPPGQDEQRRAFVISHFRYERPLAAAPKILPDLVSQALKCLELINSEEGIRSQNENFGGRLGLHLAFYFWNELFENKQQAQNVLDRFFTIASASDRARTINEIGVMFADIAPESKYNAIFNQVMLLWENRFSQIKRSIESGTDSAVFVEELTEFIGWLNFSCFDFEWRYEMTLHAMELMSQEPRSYDFIGTLGKLSHDHLQEAIQLLHVFVTKLSDEFRWFCEENQLKPLLQKGLDSSNPQTGKLASEIQDMLLQRGFFAFLEMAPRELAPAS